MIVEFPSGADRIRGALHSPAGATPRAGVVIVPDVWGLSEHYEQVARKIAARGHLALVLDLYTRGESPQRYAPHEVAQFIAQLPDRQVLGDIQAAIDALGARPELAGRRVGITGFCMGGMYTWLAACNCRGLSAAAAWYGMLRATVIDERNPEHALDAIARLRCPALGLFGAEDALIPLGQVEELRARGAWGGLDLEIVVYPGAGHAFNNDTRPDAFRPEASADAWQRVFAFFDRTLQAPSSARSEP
jgi:carboxymethylenebutenolidase